MKNVRNKTTATAIALFLVLTISATLVTLPAASAHSPPWTVPTWTYAATTNNPIGVNQDLVLVWWLNAYPPTANGAYGDRWTFNVVITKPDGTKTNLGPFISDPVGSGWTIYKPDQPGEYSFVVNFVQKKVDGTPNGYDPAWGPASFGYASDGDIYAASTSDPVHVTVQQNPIQPWQEPPVTTQYWERPLNGMNRNWYVLAGNWLKGAAQNVGPTTNFAYGKGPETAHVLWTRREWAGGLMDERFGDIGYQTSHYDGLSFSPIIMDGKIFYNSIAAPHIGWWCVDLYTGETLYYHNTTGSVTGITFSGFDYSGGISQESLAFGQIYDYDSPNQHGGFPYLWSTGAMGSYAGTMDSSIWLLFDAVTGNYICKLINVPSWAGAGSMFGPAGGTNVYGADGSITYYNIAGTTNPANPFAPATAPFYLQVWNTSRALWVRPFSANTYWMWRTYLNYTFDGNNGYSLNVSLPDMTGAGSVRAVREGKYVIGGTSGKNNGTYIQQGQLWALSLKAGEEGKLLWNITYTPPQTIVPDLVGGGLFGGGLMSGPTVDPEDGVFVFREPMTRQWWGYSMATGQKIWGPTAPENAWNFYGMSSNIYKGMLISYGGGMSGSEMIAYEIKTGKVLWKYTPSQEGFESPYGLYPLSIAAICDGKIYTTSTEHSPTQPLWRGSYLRCINATDGIQLFKLSLWGGGGGMSDGYYVGLSFYDNQIYAVGKGPSATTVNIQNDVIPLGSNVMIKGTVTDQSPGAPGTPAISDADQQKWMEYIYEQQAKPTNAKGVPVHVTAVDPNGNTQDIGTVTSDSGGSFGMMWKPPVEGKYQIIATFEASKAYGGSSATTYLGVVPAAAAPAVTLTPTETVAPPTSTPVQTASPSPSPAVQPPTSGMPTTTYIAIGAAVIIIVAAAAALTLRRRK